MLEPLENQYTKIGTIARSHGVDGDVLIIPEIYAPALFDDLDLVRIVNARGDLIPARPESVRVQEKNNRLSFFVKFEHVSDRTEAEELKKCAVYAEANIVEQGMGSDEESADYTDFSVKADGAIVGSVAGVVNNTAQAILQVETDSGQLLVPMVDEYIIEIDYDSDTINCQNINQLRV